MKKLLKNISPFNNRTNMSLAFYIIKKTLAFWLCYIAGLFIAEGLAILLHFAMGKNMLVGDVLDAQTITLIQYYGFIVIIAIVLIYWKFIEKKPLSAMGINKKLGCYVVGIVLSVILLALSVGCIILLGKIEYNGIFDNINILMLILMIGGFVVQGAMEEFLCRGLLLCSLKEKVSLPIAIFVSTVMFIIPHWSSLFAGETIYGVIGVANLILFSIICSLLVIRQKSIWGACGLHSLWNAILYSVMGLNVSGKDGSDTAIFNMQSVGDNIINGSEYGIEASVITAVILCLFAILLVATSRKKLK